MGRVQGCECRGGEWRECRIVPKEEPGAGPNEMCRGKCVVSRFRVSLSGQQRRATRAKAAAARVAGLEEKLQTMKLEIRDGSKK